MVFHISERITYAVATTETTLYVDIVAGNDGYDGTISNPLRSIQEAINRYIPPYSPAPNWPTGDDKTIIVVYSPGMPSITEELVKPAHVGSGVLFIQAEVRIEALVTQSGSVDLEPGHQSLRRLNFTTSPFVDSSLTDGYFVSWVDKSFGPNAEASITMPIVGNGDGYVLGLLDSFEESFWIDGVDYQIVQPQILWDEITGSSLSNPLIMNNGGKTILEGFIMDRMQRVVGRHQTLMSDNTAVGSIASYPTDFVMFIIKGMQTLSGPSNHFSLRACYLYPAGSAFFIRYVQSGSMRKCYIDGDGGEIQIAGISNMVIGNCYFEGLSPSTNKLLIFSTDSISIFNCDFRSGYNLFCQNASGRIEFTTFEGMDNAAITFDKRSQFDINTVTGSINNSSFGIIVREGSYLFSSTGATVTGSLGDIVVGSSPALSYSDLPITDISTLSVAE